MNIKRLALLSTGLLVLSGCAAMQTPTAEHHDSTPYDKRYVAAVNGLAHTMGTRVIWINPPLAAATEKSGE